MNISVNEVAAVTGAHPATVRRWIREKGLTARRIGRRAWMVDEDDLDAFLARYETRGAFPPRRGRRAARKKAVAA